MSTNQRATTPRLPDFLIIGAMKSGTTSLYWWLKDHPDFQLPSVKEPHYFSREANWRKGVSWYSALFESVPHYLITGEASASYSDPRVSEIVAQRILSIVPEAKLIYLVRHPIDRLRSHYRHEVQRSRESRTLQLALQDPNSGYVAQSRYYSCLEPYIKRFPTEQLLVISLDELQPNADGTGWRTILNHLGAHDAPSPSTIHNITSDKRQFTRMMLYLWSSGVLRFAQRAPKSVRHVGARLLLRDGQGDAELLRSAEGPIPNKVFGLIADDVVQIEKWLGRSLWSEMILAPKEVLAP